MGDRRFLKIQIFVVAVIFIYIFVYLFLISGPRGKFYYCTEYGKAVDTYFEFLGNGMARLCEEGQISSANYIMDGDTITLYVDQKEDPIEFTYSRAEKKIYTDYGEWRK